MAGVALAGCRDPALTTCAVRNDREAIDKEPFIADGGFNRLNKVFGGELETILAGINEEMWKKTA
jgi:hypothetical protein